MHFFTYFNAASQDILEKVGQEAALKDVEKGAKRKCLKFADRFMTEYYNRGQNCEERGNLSLDRIHRGGVSWGD